jgi:hypothetical protein
VTLEIKHWDALERALRVATQARRLFGDAAQDTMLVEECGELIIALARRERGRGTESEVDEELADILLVVLGAMNPDVWRHLAAKADRLSVRLDRHRLKHSEEKP